MNEFITALEIASKFLPDRSIPGFNCVLIERTETACDLYATEGTMIVRIRLAPEVFPVGGPGPLFIGEGDVPAIIEKFRHVADVSVAEWGGSLMITGGTEVFEPRPVPGDLGDKYREFFQESPRLADVAFSYPRIRLAVDACAPILVEWKGCGQIFYIRPQEVHWDNEGRHMALLKMSLLPSLTLIKDVTVVLMGALPDA